MLLALARRPLAATEISAGNCAAARTQSPAGRACSGTSTGSVARSSVSELGNGARLLGRGEDLVHRSSGRGRDSRGNRAFNERGVGDPKPRDGLVGQLAQCGPNREHRAAEVHQDDRAARPGRFPEGDEHAATVGSERSVRPTASRHDRHARPCDLGDELRQAVSDRRTMGHEHEADKAVPGLRVHRGAILQCRTPFDNSHQ
jgi:hypothetical protein